ncbi:MAG: hypothetical protein ACKOBM_11225 [Gammaproteobacteria bacterium]
MPATDALMQSPPTVTPPLLSNARLGLAASLIALVGIAFCVGFHRDSTPVDLPPVPVIGSASETRVNCLSYTPRGMVPGPDARVFRSGIDADLKRLSHETGCVRTYSSTQGMDQVPEVARAHGMTVLQGIWIGRDAQQNARELAAGLAAARAYPDVVRALVVGNEVLLRHEQTVPALREILLTAQAASDVPVTYADVWEFWRTGAALADAVDFVTIHILPYWENEPVGVQAALLHVASVHADMQRLFPQHALMIGETGWPTAGRPREGAHPGRVEAARFVREFVGWAAAEGVDYNLIEAFDQPWKRGLEGTVGGYWGLFDVSGDAKFPLTGPVIERPLGAVSVALPTTGLAIGALVGLLIRRGLGAALLGAVFGFSVGASGAELVHYLPAANRSTIEWLQSAAAIGVALSLSGVLAFQMLKHAAPQRPNADLAALGHNGLPRVVHGLCLGFTFGFAYVCLGLVLDGRYRDFPIAVVALPITLLALRRFVFRAPDVWSRELQTLAALIGVCALAGVAIEGSANLRALAWSGFAALLALTLLWRVPTQHQDRQQQAGAGGIEAVQHTTEHPAGQRHAAKDR